MTSFALWPFAHWKSVEICLRASMGMVVKRKIPVTEILGLKHLPLSPQPTILITALYLSQLH